MIYIFLIIWILCGVSSVFMAFNSARKDWYKAFGEEYWNSRSETALRLLLILSPIFIFGGILSLSIFLAMTPRKEWCIWFKLPKNKYDQF